jgi:hypothetical protein
MEVSIPQDEEFKKLLREALEKPDEWYMEKVERAVKGRGTAKGKRSVKQRTVRVPRKR